jgi:hypothetical protein
MAAANPFARFADGTILDGDDGSSVIIRGGKAMPYNANADPTAQPISAGSDEDQKELKAYREAARTGLAAAKVGEEFVGINRSTSTGGMKSRPAIPMTKALPGAPLWGDITSAMFGDPGWAQMKGITSSIIPKMRAAGSGPMTEGDAQMYREALPNINYPGPANQARQAQLQKDSDLAAARSAFADVWFSKRGTLLGSEAAFNKFWREREMRKALEKAPRIGDPPRAARPAPASPPAGDGWAIER